MTDQTTRSPAKADPSTLTLEFRHIHRLVDPGAEGIQAWQISLLADDETVARVRATRGQYWKAHNLGERLADEQSLAAVAAEQLFDANGQFRPEYPATATSTTYAPWPCGGRRPATGKARKPSSGTLPTTATSTPCAALPSSGRGPGTGRAPKPWPGRPSTTAKPRPCTTWPCGGRKPGTGKARKPSTGRPSAMATPTPGTAWPRSGRRPGTGRAPKPSSARPPTTARPTPRAA